VEWRRQVYVYADYRLSWLRLKRLGLKPGPHSPQIGWSADGFPVYALLGYSEPKKAESAIVELKSSFRLKDGNRPAGDAGPGGKYDGTFVQDYEFVNGVGDLDECNGRRFSFDTSPAIGHW